MKNILLVFTGGTIGSKAHEGAITTVADSRFQLIARFEQHYPLQAEIAFTTLQPLQILSENLHPHHWCKLLAAIEAYDLTQFDGIIITHGTDTLSFTAAMLATYFHRLDKPLLLVSSNLPLDQPQANGLENFICAVEFIRQNVRAGVFVAYKNPGGTSQIHLGSQLMACLPLSADFISVASGPVFQFENDIFHSLNPVPHCKSTEFDLSPIFAPISLIRPYPGLDYDNIRLDDAGIVLHELYHSGTACASDEWGDRYSLSRFIEHCSQRNIPLYLAPSLALESAYQSTHDILNVGGNMLWNMTLETAFAKLALAYGNWSDAQTIERFLADHRTK
ncbi:MAG: asparaginase [Methylomonas sp.]|nr:asparaginase [Methylomonas sp.]PPD19475.1 MAG: L-asparaginase [Methylomonas sp.]PPD25206.1 MAG: L-asparaginase [Methylomonas sp.]PPD34868.1 MAG: L-asparaginase [Methylomonas sp.]PPD38037.1 MAG: L-asparaginase [Methylomonas sp.]